MFDYKITIIDNGVVPAQGVASIGQNPTKDFTYAQLTAQQKATYDAFVAMIKTL